MKKSRTLLMIPFILLMPIVSVALLPSAHASPATGTVCLSTNTSVCQTSFGATSAVGSSLTVYVLIQNSDPLNGFDVQVTADHSILAGTGMSLTGGILGTSASIVVECLDGSLVVGSTCTPQDGVGVLHLAAGITGGNIGSAGATSGVLFTMTYTVQASSTGTPVSFNTGCSGTSVASTCVTITNGTITPNSEVVQNATFANVSDFTIAISPSQIETTPGVAGSATITLTALGTFSDLVQLSVDPSSTISGSITSPANGLCDLTVPTCTGSLSVGPAVAGTYTVTVDAAGISTPVSHMKSATVIVSLPTFKIAASPSSLSIPPLGSDTSVITITPISGFTDNVMLSATTPSGVSASFGTNPVTGGSGTSTLTVSVSSSGVSGTITVTGTDQGNQNAGTKSAMISLTVQFQDFTLLAVPGSVGVPRGSSVVSTINIISVGNFAGPVTFSAAITNQGTDSAGLTTNITPVFSPPTVTLPIGGSVSANFFATTVKSSAFGSSTDTATGNYTATITATIGGRTHTALITFNVFDFSLGPVFCPGTTPIFTSPDLFATIGAVNYDPVFVGAQCNTLTVTTQTVADGGSDGLGVGLSASTLWMQVNALGGFISNGSNGNGVAGINPQLPGRGASSGVSVPELGFNVCLAQTFWANGTQISYTYLRAHGPIIAPGAGLYVDIGFNYGCRFDAGAYPADIANPDGFIKNPDFLAVTAQSLSTTLPGTYFFNICALAGSLFNCQRLTLVVVQAPVVSQFLYTRSNGFSASHGGHFNVVISNVDPTHTLSVQLTVTGTGSTGDSFTLKSKVVIIAPSSISNTITLFVSLTPAMIGETFTFTSFISVGASSTPGSPGLTGASTLQAVSATFTVVP